MNVPSFLVYWRGVVTNINNDTYRLPFVCVLTNGQGVNDGVTIESINFDSDRVVLCCTNRNIELNAGNNFWIKYGRDANGKPIFGTAVEN